MRPAAWSNGRAWLYQGKDIEVLAEMPGSSIQCIVTSPPYFGLRDYGVADQRGLEASPSEYVAGLVELYREARRVLADDGLFFLNLGDSYASAPGNGRGGGSALQGRKHDAVQGVASNLRRKPGSDVPRKSLMMLPARVAIALVDDGWTLRNDNIWHKTNAMPYSGTDRFATTYEHVYMFSKSERYYFDIDAVRVPMSQVSIARAGRARLTAYEAPGQTANKRSESAPNPLGKNPGDVWDIPTKPFAEAHFAVYPPALPERCILAGSRPGDVVLDPASGSGTTGMVALQHGRRYVGVELNQEYIDLSIRTRFAG